MQNSAKPVSTTDAPVGESADLAKWFETCADTLYEAASTLREREQRAAQQRQMSSQSILNIEQATTRQDDKLTQLIQRVGHVEPALSGLSREFARSADLSARVLQRLETIEFNLEQVRRLADASGQKQQQLVDDFIERRVTDHLFMEFLKIQFALARYSANGNPNLKADIQSIADAIEAFLSESGLRIIQPQAGAPFDPREHQPVKLTAAMNGRDDGTIAETFTPGLSRSHRVIQQARVAVFKANGRKNTT
jgi:molecular chaperone GrpE (heat shock protein)